MKKLKVFAKNLINKFGIKSMFTRLLVFFNILVFLSISMVTIFSYFKSEDALLMEVKSSNISALSQTQSIFDQYLTYIDDIMMQISRDYKVKEAYSYNRIESTNQIDTLYDIHRRLTAITKSNSFVQNIWIYLNKSDHVLSSKYGSMPFEYFLTNLKVYNELEYNDWKEILSTNNILTPISNISVTEENYTKNIICFIKSLPIVSSSPEATIIIEVDERLLFSNIGYFDESNDNGIIILDNNNQHIISSKKSFSENTKEKIIKELDFTETFEEKLIRNKLYLISTKVSNKSGWKYISITEKNRIYARINSIRDFNIIIAFVSICIGFIISIMLATKMYNPVKQIVQYLSYMVVPSSEASNSATTETNKIKKQNEFDFINRFINNVYTENKSLKENMQKSIPLIEEKCLIDLLEGNANIDTLDRYNKIIDIDFLKDQFQVIIIEYDEIDNTTLPYNKTELRNIISDINTNLINEVIIYYINNKNKITLIFNFSQNYNSLETIYNYVKKLMKILNESYHLLSVAGAGNSYSTKDAIEKSYKDAQYALKFKIIKGHNEIIDINELGSLPSNPIDYSLKKERILINYAKSCDEKSCENLIKEVYEKNTSKDISVDRMHRLSNAFAGTIIRIVNDLQIPFETISNSSDSLYRELLDTQTIEENKNLILKYINNIIAYLKSKKQTQYDKIYKDIVEYIDENYYQDISLNVMSDHFGLSPSYLSWIFSEASGNTFLDFLNKKRVWVAKQMIENDKNIRISKLSLKVGFNSSNTFIRVFKKYEGITPGKYKKSL